MDRLGPYASEVGAANALESARVRSELWDAEDERWDEEGWGVSRPVPGGPGALPGVRV